MRSLLLLAALAPVAGASAAPVLDCAARDVVLVLDERTTLRTVPLPEGATLWLEERGDALVVTTDATRRSLEVPPRLGLHAVSGSGQAEATIETRSGRYPARALATLDCDADAGARSDWMEDAAALSARLTRGVGSAAGEDLDGALQALALRAKDARETTWTRHLQAQALLMAGRASEAAEAFLAVSAAWRAAGDPARADAALVAALEDLNRAAAFARVLELDASAGTAGTGYYAVRRTNARCLALRYLGRLDDAGACYTGTTRQLLALGETLELAVTTLDFGTIELDRGRLESAIDLFARSRELAQGLPDAHDETGRAEFYLADAHARAGRIGESLAHLQAAMVHFERAGSGRWLGSSQLRFGQALAELGAFADARRALAQGLSRFDEANAPARIAGGEMAMARLALRAGDATEASRAATRAASIYERLSMPMEAALAQELQLRAALAAGDAKAADALAVASAAQPTASQRIALAEWALARGDVAAARTHLEGARTDAGPLSDRVRRQRLAVALLAHEQGADAALAAAQAHADEWTRLAQRSASPVLRERLEGFPESLLADAVDLVAAELLAGRRDAPEAWADRLLRLVPVATRATHEPTDDAPWQAIDRELAASLFPGLGGGIATGTALLGALNANAGRTGNEGAPLRLTLRRVQSGLRAGDRTLLVLDGVRHALVVHIAPGSVAMHAVAAREDLLDEAESLQAAVRQRDTPIGTLHSRAARLRESLALAAAAEGVSGTTRVFATGRLNRLPWPLLLEGEGETRGVTLLSARAEAAATTARAPRVTLFQASRALAGALPALPGAAREHVVLQSAVPGLAIDAHSTARRDDVIAALARPGAWVHVAAHGTLAPGRLGGAGLWLDAPDEGTPRYLGWLELIERGVHAGVVVLDACQLGEGGLGVDGPVGFSEALLRAGAGEVIAAQWPLSDTASALWVGAFYRSAFGASEPLAHALASARGALRRSRAFRHPYHWAGLVHHEALVP